MSQNGPGTVKGCPGANHRTHDFPGEIVPGAGTVYRKCRAIENGQTPDDYVQHQPGCIDQQNGCQTTANNSIGNLAQNDIVVNKDIEPPIININSPYEGQFFGTSSFWFDLTILEGNLDSIWYSLNNGLNVSFSGTNGTIDQDEWDKCENGTVLLKFYANDSLGYLTLETVTVNKDIHYPIIEINTPITAQLVGKNAFKYNISVFEPNLDTLWFTLNDSSPNRSEEEGRR